MQLPFGTPNLSSSLRHLSLSEFRPTNHHITRCAFCISACCFHAHHSSMHFKILPRSSSSPLLSTYSPPSLSHKSYSTTAFCLNLHRTLRSIPVSSEQIASEASLSQAILPQLKKCPSDVYVMISQPGVNAVDFQDPFSAPHLQQKLMGEDERIRSSLIVSEVVGRFDSANLTKIVQDRCGARLLEIDASSKFGMAGHSREFWTCSAESDY